MCWFALGFFSCIAIIFQIVRKMYSPEEVDVSKKVLVVTGCDSGIGHALAVSAKKWGCTVIGTCLDPVGKAGNNLRSAGVHVVRLDLTESDATRDLLNLLKQLEADGDEMWCVVNNAGIMTFAACEWQTEQMIAQQIQVNLTGSIQVTASLLPKIRRNKGRIILVSSPTGQVASPNMSVYCASKYGMEGFAMALRREVQCLGVNVSVVRPCNLPNQTNILSNNSQRLKEMIAQASNETREDYGDLMRKSENNFAQGFGGLEELRDIKDSYLIQCFRSAILCKKPRTVYSAAPLAVRTYLNLAQVLPTKVMDFWVLRGYHDKVLSLAYIR